MSIQVPGANISNLVYGDGAPFRKFVVAGSTGNITLPDIPNGTTGDANMDNVPLVVGDRVLLKDQITGAENGIYYVNAVTVAPNVTIARTADAYVGSSFAAVSITINQGATNGNSIMMCSNVSGSDVIGTDALTFVASGSVSQVNTGTGLTGGPITTTGTISMDNMASYTYKGNNTNIAGAPTDITLSDLRNTLTKIFYVNNSTGNDSNSGKSSSEPFLTVNQALDSLLGTSGQIILVDTGITYVYTPANIPNNVNIRFSTSVTPITSYSAWTTLILTGSSVNATPQLLTLTDSAGNVRATGFVPSALAISYPGGHVIQFTSGAYNTQYALISADYIRGAPFSGEFTFINGDFSSLVGGETFDVYAPPVTLSDNATFTSATARNTTLIFNNINYVGVNAVDTQSISWIFDYSRYSDQGSAVSFASNDCTFRLLNSSWNTGANDFRFTSGNMNVDMANSIFFNYGNSVIANGLGLVGSSNGKLQMNNSTIMVPLSSVAWGLSSADTSIADCAFLGFLNVTNCSSSNITGCSFYTGGSVTTAPASNTFTNSLVTLGTMNIVTDTGAATQSALFTGCKVNINTMSVENITTSNTGNVIQFDQGTVGSMDGAVTFSNCVADIMIEVSDGSLLNNTSTLDSSTSTVNTYNITLSNYGEFTSSTALTSFNNGVTGVINDITGAVSYTTAILASYSLPYRFTSTGLFSTARDGIVPRLSGNVSESLRGDGTYSALPIRIYCIAGSVANVNLGATLDGVVMDGVTLATGDRIFLKDQSSTVDNGIYVVNTSPAVPTRASDVAVGTSFGGTITLVNQGTLNSNTSWLCTNIIGSDVVGTNGLTFSIIGAKKVTYSYIEPFGGIQTLTMPSGYSAAYLSCWGGGGGGGASTPTYSGGGGGSGAGVFNYPLDVTPGTAYNIFVGYGGNTAGVAASGFPGSMGGVSGVCLSSNITVVDSGNTTINGPYYNTNIQSYFVRTAGTYDLSTIPTETMIMANTSSLIWRVNPTAPDPTTFYVYGSIASNSPGLVNEAFSFISTGVFAWGGGGGVATTPSLTASGGTNYRPGAYNSSIPGIAGGPSSASASSNTFGGNYFGTGVAGGLGGNPLTPSNSSVGYSLYSSYLGGTTTINNSTGGGGAAGYGGVGGEGGITTGLAAANGSGAGGGGGGSLGGNGFQAGQGGSGLVEIVFV
jgi:hypothetical protein